jgi:hypothetical protein
MEMVDEAPFNAAAQVGSANKVIQYTANGECTDWMLGKKGIIAWSPELGDGTLDGFFPTG